MSSTTWEEIKKLAADFQRVQLVESSYKLSERNCIELINKLTNLGLINLYYSTDGKEFITHKHLEKEIVDEILVHEGRINIVDLQTLLNIDISYIETKVSEIVKDDPNLCLILGQIISKDYMNKISEEINEFLKEKGSVSIAELTNIYSLPADFLYQIIKTRMGTIIKGNFDGNIIYTHNYVNHQKSLLTGILEATIKPIRFSQLIKEYNLDQSMIFDIYDELTASGQIKGAIFGSRQAASAVFVPDFFTKAQDQYVQAFFKQNGFIDFLTLKKIGITEPEIYVKETFANQDIIFLSSSCLANYFIVQMEQEIEEQINKSGICEIMQILPSNLTHKDVSTLSEIFCQKLKPNIDCIIMAETYLISKNFIKVLQNKFQEKMELKSKDDLTKKNIVLSIKSETLIVGSLDGKPVNSSKGSKSKSKKSLQENDNILVEIIFIDKNELMVQLKSLVGDDINDDLLDSLVEYFLKPLNLQYLDLLKQKVEKGLVTIAELNQDMNGKATSKKFSIKEVQEKVKFFLIQGRIFDKAFKLFTNQKVQDQLNKHLLKTSCSEITNEMLLFIANEQMVQTNEEILNTESRNKIIQKLKDPFKQKFIELNQSLTNQNSSEVIDLIEKIAKECIELSVKKDQKRDKEVLLQLRESTKASLIDEKDPAIALQLTCLLLFYCSTNLFLNAPGRCVPNILEFLQPSIKEESHSKLINFQNFIIENASKSKTNETPIISNELVEEIKTIGLNAKEHLLENKN